jgi:general secretion pathway protein D
MAKRTERAKELVWVVLTAAFCIYTFTETPHSYAQNETGDVGAATEEALAKDASTEINVKNADIAAIVRIFSKKTKRNYILDENVRGKVTIYLPGKVSSDEAIRILDTVLQLKGFTSVPVGENLWKIIQAKDAKQTTVPLLTEEREGTPSAAVVTRLMNLKYVKAEDLQQLLQQLISPSGLVNAYPGTNSLLLIDAEDNIERLFRIVQSLDVPFSNREMTIIPIKHADAKDIAEKLNEIMGVNNNAGGEGRASLGRAAAIPPPINQGSAGAVPVNGSQQATGATQQIGARGVEPKIIPDERTNSIIIVADEDMTARIRALVSELDSSVDLSGNQFFVYRCQHANAEDLAQVLSGLMGGGGGAGGAAPSGGIGGNNARLNNAIGGGGLGGANGGGFNSGLGNQNGVAGSGGFRSRAQRVGTSGDGGQQQNRGSVTAQIGENISVTADPATNSLVINASKSDYEKIKLLLTQLDIKRRQVLVEAMLLEVGISDESTLGTEFITSGGGADGGVVAKNDFGNLANLFSDPNKISGFSIAAASAGSLQLPGNITIPSQSVLLTAAQNNRNVNVLSAPNILATDNEEAEIVVGENIPFLASVAANQVNLGNTFNQVDRQDVGIKLRLTPQISSRDYVTLTLFTEVSNVLSTSDQLGPTTTVRSSQTTIIAKNGQMIVTGGLMFDNSQNTANGVPFLSDVPVLGHLFKRSGDRVIKTNLLIFITPRILKDQFDARDATVVRRSQMKDVISAQQAYPDRNEVLFSKDIDNVTEASLAEGPKPGTIRAPRQAVKDIELPPLSEATGDDARSRISPEEALASAQAMRAESQTQGEEAVLELEASPKVPDNVGKQVAPPKGIAGSPDQADSTETKTDLHYNLGESVAAEPGSAKINAGPAQPEVRFIVFAINPKEEIPISVPFAIDPERLTFGVQLTERPDQPFFKLGSVYAYSIGGSTIHLKPLGIFSSAQDAASRFPEVQKKWHALSNHEIANLGKGPWRTT